MDIRWGMIGCGDVTEVKSGPAFNKVKNSSLVAVMRRDLEKARAYALKHNVPAFYNEANSLLKNPDVNAVYIATPPSSHGEYALAAIEAGKDVYLEKPMALNSASAERIVAAAIKNKVKLTVAHYRRQQPIFLKIKQLLAEKAIGEIELVTLEYYRKPYTALEMTEPGKAWRINPAISGGGLFHDLAPHQLDLMFYFFGEMLHASGYALNQSNTYPAHDLVTGTVQFKSGVLFNGLWYFNATKEDERDAVVIYGSKGKIQFSVFQHEHFTLCQNNGALTFNFDKLLHVQQPLIEKTVSYFLEEAPNPCSGEDGAKVMELIDLFSASANKRNILNV